MNTYNTRSLPMALLCFLAAVIITLAGCTKEDQSAPYTDNGRIYFTGNATAAQMVPAGTSTGTAVFRGMYDVNSQIFNYQINWYGLAGGMTSASFYGPALAGQTGPATRSIATAQTKLATDSISGVIWTYSKLTDAELADLKNGKWYYIINTTANGSGEIRGQISLQK